MSKQFSVKGVNPAGRVMEALTLADGATDAKTKAEKAGLKLVVVTEEPAITPEEEGGETRTRPERPGRS